MNLFRTSIPDNYRKSSITPPGAYLIFNLLEGGLI